MGAKLHKHRELRNCARVGLSNLVVELVNTASDSGDLRADNLQGRRLPVEYGDISLGGVGFYIDETFPPLVVGDQVRVQFQLPDGLDEMTVHAELKHVQKEVDGGQRVGGEFLDADELVSLPVFRYIEESLLALRTTSQVFSLELSPQPSAVSSDGTSLPVGT